MTEEEVAHSEFNNAVEAADIFLNSDFGIYTEESIEEAINLVQTVLNGFMFPVSGNAKEVLEEATMELLQSVNEAKSRLEVRLISMSAATSNSNLQNNTTVTIAVTGHYADGSAVVLAYSSVRLRQNGTQTVQIGDYIVTVVVNDNNRISDIYVGIPDTNTGRNQNGNSQR
jgi:hypothetical protein